MDKQAKSALIQSLMPNSFEVSFDGTYALTVIFTDQSGEKMRVKFFYDDGRTTTSVVGDTYGVVWQADDMLFMWRASRIVNDQPWG